tara:strand:+ start:804074 stop:805186 length:1113 start_codon:yes stop_codon:yes gene_type:complete
MQTDDEQGVTEQSTKVRMRVDQIRADRACIGCGFNLFGQRVTKEPHYGLAITRCPECGEVAAIQTYPTMSHWVNRVRVILTAVWVVVLVGVFFANTMAMVGMCAGAIEIGSDELGDEIGVAHQVWVDTQTQRALDLQKQNESVVENPVEDLVTDDGTGLTTPDRAVVLNDTNSTTSVTSVSDGITTTVVTRADGTTSTTINGAAAVMYSGSFSYTSITPAWIEHEYEYYIESLDGVWGHIDRQFMILFLPTSVIAFASGIFWSVVLLGARRRNVVWIPLVISIVVLGFVISMNSMYTPNQWASEVANTLVAPRIAPLILGVQLVFAIVGIFLGRKIARFVVLLTLPPRSRVSLSILWTRDGLELPKPVMK